MTTLVMCNMKERPRYQFKKYPFIYMGDDVMGEFCQMLQGVLHVEDIREYIHCNFESIGDNDIF